MPLLSAVTRVSDRVGWFEFLRLCFRNCFYVFFCCLFFSAGYSEMESNFLFHKYDRDCDQVLSFLERRKMREDMAMGVGSIKTIYLISSRPSAYNRAAL